MRAIPFRLAVLLALSPVTCLAEPEMAGEPNTTASTPALVEVKHNVHDPGPNQYLVEGDQLNVQVTAIGGVDVYVYVIYHDANEDSFLLFPNAFETNNLVAAETSRNVPGEDSRVAFALRSPFGAERLQIIASRERRPELERAFNEGESADKLKALLEQISVQPQVEASTSEFEVRPADGERVDSGPEMVQ